MPTRRTVVPIRILHLSDIHFRIGRSWDADPVLRHLTSFIRSEVEQGLAPDLLVISGDLAFSGKAEEYTRARAWLDGQLWPALPEGLPHDRLLLVPGNHDVDRSKVSAGARLMQDGLLKASSQENIAALLGDEGERSVMLRRHTAYLDFCKDWFNEPQPLSWWQRVIEIRGTRLHVAGLDSAWMSCGDEDRSRLLLGRCQLTETVETAQAEDADWRIAVLHHPWGYLAEFNEIPSRSAVHQHCDLLLRGHLHQPLSRHVVAPDPSRACLELAAGCVYEDSKYPNAFQWIELLPTSKRVRVLFRAWLYNVWTVDRNLPGCPEGLAEFDLGGEPLPERGTGPSAAPPIPPEYLAWLERRCASVELVGQDIKQSHALTLSHVYVPALTTNMSMAQGQM